MENLTIEIGKSTEALYPEVVDIRRQVFVDEQGVPASLEIDRFEGGCDFFLAKIGGRPVGCGRLRIDGPLVKFERIATLTKNRGKGVGRALLNAMEAFSLANYEAYLLYMHAQLTAAAFYKRLGWLPTDRGTFWEAGIAHEELVKPPGDLEKLAKLKLVTIDNHPLAAWLRRYQTEALGVRQR